MIKPIDLDLPAKFPGFRPNQFQIASKIAASQKYAFLLDAPTGTGKSLIAATAQRLSDVNAVYLCVTKQLQDQVLNDFPYAKTLMGRSNYICLKYPKMFPNVSAEECTHTSETPCSYRDRCPYTLAKDAALKSPLAVLNMAYFISEVNYVGAFKNRKLLIIDEFDEVESQLMNHVELRITRKQIDRYGLGEPKLKTKVDSWHEWAKDALSILVPKLILLQSSVEIGGWGGLDFKSIKECTRLERLVSKFKYFIKEVDDTWVSYSSQDGWSFKPTWVSKYANGVLWDHAEKVLGMSATILDPRQISLNTGLMTKTGRFYDYLQMESNFPKENRPVYYKPVANVVNKSMEFALPRLANSVKEIMASYPNDRILIHTVSYRVLSYLKQSIKSDRIITHSTADRTTVLNMFKASTKPLVLLSPSMERGVDLPDDQCRVVVIAKVPYPDLGDNQISRRVYGSRDGNRWYAHQTISSIIQMSGRAVRSSSDHAEIYILDGQFEKIYNEYNGLFPKWWKDALIR